MPLIAHSTCLAVFAKAPCPGSVKTRLMPLLGPQEAAALHARLVLRTLETAGAVAPDVTRLYCAPSSADPFFAHCRIRYGVRLHDQGAGDLGRRMLQAFEDQLAPGRAVLLIGTDCPMLKPAQLLAAEEALRGGADAVFVPTEDGGYALIGLARCDARLFEGIAWGSDRVMEATRHRLRRLEWRWEELDACWDVDRPDDYRRLVREGWLETLPQ